jgi:hypothetical protein
MILLRRISSRVQIERPQFVFLRRLQFSCNRGTQLASITGETIQRNASGDSMETATPNNVSPAAASAMRTLELVREVEHVLHEMDADLTLAEAKIAHTRELLARRREGATINA